MFSTCKIVSKEKCVDSGVVSGMELLHRLHLFAVGSVMMLPYGLLTTTEAGIPLDF